MSHDEVRRFDGSATLRVAAGPSQLWVRPPLWLTLPWSDRKRVRNADLEVATVVGRASARSHRPWDRPGQRISRNGIPTGPRLLGLAAPLGLSSQGRAHDPGERHLGRGNRVGPSPQAARVRRHPVVVRERQSILAGQLPRHRQMVFRRRCGVYPLPYARLQRPPGIREVSIA